MSNRLAIQKKYVSSKKYHQSFPVAYRQWKDKDGNCSLIHGYALSITLQFETDVLSEKNWAMDFGGLRELKHLLEEWFDHSYLLATDDPFYDDIKKLGDLGLAKITEVDQTGCEALSDWLYEYINTIYLPTCHGTGEADRLWCCLVEIRETDSNAASRSGHREWAEFT